jgi:hypothetical protein
MIILKILGGLFVLAWIYLVWELSSLKDSKNKKKHLKRDAFCGE